MKKILLLLIMGIIGVFSVSAQSTTIYSDYQVPNMYITRIQGGQVHNGAPFMLHKSDGTLIYCIEPFVMPIDGNYTIYDNYTDIFNLSGEQIDRINLIAKYGYGYGNHTDIKWYGITQYMIWQTIVDQIYFTDVYHGTRVNMYESEINEINSLIDNYNIKPKFKDMYMVITGDEYTFEDENGVLENYELVNSYTNLDVKVNGNKVTVKASEDGTYRIYFRKRDNNHHYELYYHPSSQNQILPGRVNDVESSAYIYASKGSLMIQKHDLETDISQVNNSFEGAKYGVYNYATGELFKEVTLNNNGYGYIDKIPCYTFDVKELVAPYGYQLNDTKYRVDINGRNQNPTVDVYDKAIKKKIIIHKKYGSTLTNNYYDEEGAYFNLYDKNNNLIGEYQTNELGIIELNLPFGEYVLKQVSGREYYTLVDDIHFIIDDDSEIIYELKNEEIKRIGNIHIIKKGSDGYMLDGVIFEIYAMDDITSLDGYIYHHKGDLIDTVKTINGFIDYNNLYYGNYYLKEIKTNDGYHILNDNIEFSIDSNDKNIEVINDKISEIVRVPNTYANDIDYPETIIVLFILFSYCIGLQIIKKEN